MILGINGGLRKTSEENHPVQWTCIESPKSTTTRIPLKVGEKKREIMKSNVFFFCVRCSVCIFRPVCIQFAHCQYIPMKTNEHSHSVLLLSLFFRFHCVWILYLFFSWYVVVLSHYRQLLLFSYSSSSNSSNNSTCFIQAMSANKKNSNNNNSHCEPME